MQQRMERYTTKKQRAKNAGKKNKKQKMKGKQNLNNIFRSSWFTIYFCWMAEKKQCVVRVMLMRLQSNSFLATQF